MISFHTTLTDTIELLAFVEKEATQNESEWKWIWCMTHVIGLQCMYVCMYDYMYDPCNWAKLKSLVMYLVSDLTRKKKQLYITDLSLLRVTRTSFSLEPKVAGIFCMLALRRATASMLAVEAAEEPEELLSTERSLFLLWMVRLLALVFESNASSVAFWMLNSLSSMRRGICFFGGRPRRFDGVSLSNCCDTEEMWEKREEHESWRDILKLTDCDSESSGR